jgi:guanylate kinase
MTNPLKRRGLMFVLSSPSGAGKTTVSRRMLEADAQLSLSISCTTRARRSNELHGRDYFFVSHPEFETMVSRGEFLEHATVFDHRYGTPRGFVEDALSKGQDVLFDVDWQGTRKLKETSRQDLVSVFILPPSMAELERRLRARAQDGEETIIKRMGKARSEISHWDEYDYVVVNTDLEEAIGEVMKILEAERLKRIRQVDLPAFVKQLMR